MSPGLVIYAYDDARPLWRDLLEQWRADEATLVFPSELAERRFLESEAAATLLGRRTLTIEELWQLVSKELGLEEKPSQPLAVQAMLAQLLAGTPGLPDELTRLRSYADLDALRQHLDLIEERADRDYEAAARTDVERGLHRLRDLLADSGLVTASRHRSTTLARRAREVELERPLIFVPFGGNSLHVSGLMKGLAELNAVSLYLLTSDSQLGQLLELSRLRPQDFNTPETTKRFAGDGFAAALFGDATDSAGPSWLETDDELEAALELCERWLAEGTAPAEIGIVLGRPASAVARLQELAARRGLPLCFRSSVTAHDTRVGALLLRLAEADLDDEQALEPLLAEGVLVVEDLDAVAAARAAGALPELKALHALGLRLATPETGYELSQPESLAQAWLEALSSSIEQLELHRLDVDDVAEVVARVDAKRRISGALDGIAVVSYLEAPSFRFRRAVLGSLAAGDYPPVTGRSPFMSVSLLAALPRLGEPDRRPEFVAAVASAEQATFLRARRSDSGDTLAPSVFWEETRRLTAEKVESWSRDGSNERRRRLQRAARERVALSPEITAALERLPRERLPAGVLLGTKNSFSITELENFLGCPYGWFVSSVLHPRQRQRRAALLGTIAHDTLEAVFKLTAAERAPALAAELKQQAGLDMTEVERELMLDKLLRLLDRYGELLPGGQHHPEIDLASETLFPGFEVHGRVDRLDVSSDGLLVIDYKNFRVTNKSAAAKGKQLQRYLYPLMASEQFAVPPLGMVYVSIPACEHEGSLAKPVPSLEQGGSISYDFNEGAARAEEQVVEVHKRISEGDFLEIGDHCRDYCAHHFVSQTLVALAAEADDEEASA